MNASRRRLVLSLAASLAWPACAMSATQAASAPRTLLVVGDSISAGYGLANGEGWVTLLQKRLADARPGWRVVNASISGDTTAGGRARLPALLKEHRPSVVVIELGGNDALRGQPLKDARANLDAMVTQALAAGARVLLLGMQLPPNYGSAYVRQFGAMFSEIGTAHRVAVVPFLFDGFGEDLGFFQSDRIHPTAAAQPRILDNAWPKLEPMLARP